MSAAESGDNNSLVQQILALTRKAYSLAQRAIRALQSASNVQNTHNTSPFSPAGVITLDSSPYATVNGTTAVAFIMASGLVNQADDSLTLVLLVDGSPVAHSMTARCNSGTGAPHSFDLSTQVFVTVVKGATHTYSAQVSDLSGGNLTIADGGIQIFLSEVPA